MRVLPGSPYQPGSLAESVLGAERSTERYHCGCGPAPRHLPQLTAHGLRLSGHDEEGRVRMAELPGHPFFLATPFQPELAGSGTRDAAASGGPGPALAAAAVAHAARRADGPVARPARGPAAGRAGG
ncbi:hypothetical protein ACIRBY_24670 [Streptomyces sp. NPDC096136]|uniref:hypothetical protein n=1 Tax=Streptomyces sp. NPDC096136 TaxID=3366076 RepID=UPI0038227B07